MNKATPGSLHSKTLALLRDSEEDPLTIHCNSGLPFYWIKKFGNGDIANPSVNRVQALYEYLSKKKLGV